MTPIIKTAVIALTAFVAIMNPLTAVEAEAGERQDREAIRTLFHQEQKAHVKGNAEMVRSTYWDDFYLINTPSPNGEPHHLLSKIVSRSDYFAQMGADNDNYEGHSAFGDQLEFHSEVNHIDINGDLALAITQFNFQWPTPAGGRNDRGHMSLWVAERREGIWKWKSAQMVDSFGEVVPPPPGNNSSN